MSFLFQPKLFCIFVLKIMVSYAKPDTTKACSQEKRKLLVPEAEPADNYKTLNSRTNAIHIIKRHS